MKDPGNNKSDSLMAGWDEMKFRKEKNQGHNPYLKAAVLEMSRISSKRMILQKQETYSMADSPSLLCEKDPADSFSAIGMTSKSGT